MAAKMPDLTEYDFEELDALISEVQKVRGQKVDARRKELQADFETKRLEYEAELAKLGGGEKALRMPAGLGGGGRKRAPIPPKFVSKDDPRKMKGGKGPEVAWLKPEMEKHGLEAKDFLNPEWIAYKRAKGKPIAELGE